MIEGIEMVIEVETEERGVVPEAKTGSTARKTRKIGIDDQEAELVPIP